MSDRHGVFSWGEPDESDIYSCGDEDESMVDLGGGMVVPLRELLEDDDEETTPSALNPEEGLASLPVSGEPDQ